MKQIVSRLVSVALVFNLSTSFLHADSKIDNPVKSSESKKLKSSKSVNKLSKKDLESKIGYLTDDYLARGMYKDIVLAGVFGCISLGGWVTSISGLVELISGDHSDWHCGMEPLAYGIGILGGGAVGGIFGFLSYRSVKNAVSTNALREALRLYSTASEEQKNRKNK